MRVRPVRKSLQPGFLVGFSRLRPRCVSKKARLCRVKQIIRGHMSKKARVCRVLQFRILLSQCLGREAVSRDLGIRKFTRPAALSRFDITLHNRTFFDICPRNSCIALHTRTFLAAPAGSLRPLRGYGCVCPTRWLMPRPAIPKNTRTARRLGFLRRSGHRGIGQQGGIMALR